MTEKEGSKLLLDLRQIERLSEYPVSTRLLGQSIRRTLDSLRECPLISGAGFYYRVLRNGPPIFCTTVLVNEPIDLSSEDQQAQLSEIGREHSATWKGVQETGGVMSGLEYIDTRACPNYESFVDAVQSLAQKPGAVSGTLLACVEMGGR